MSETHPYGPVEFNLDDKGFRRLDQIVDMLRDMANGERAAKGLPLIKGKKPDLILGDWRDK